MYVCMVFMIEFAPLRLFTDWSQNMLFKSIFVTSALALFSQLSFARVDLDNVYKKLPESIQKGKLQPVLQCTQFGGEYDAVCDDSPSSESNKIKFKITQSECDTISFEVSKIDENSAELEMFELNPTGLLGYSVVRTFMRGAFGEVAYWMQNNSMVRSRLTGIGVINGGKIQMDYLKELKMSGNGSCERGVTFIEDDTITIFDDNDEADSVTNTKSVCTLCPISQ